MSRYQELFFTEAKSHLEKMNEALLKWEKTPAKLALLGEVFRSTHTLKGMCATMNFNRMAALCHAIEDLLEEIRSRRVSLADCSDAFFSALDFLSAALKGLEKGRPEPDAGALTGRLADLVKRRGGGQPAAAGGTEAAGGEQPAAAEEPAPAVEKIQSVQVKVERLDRLMNLAEELVVNRMRLDRIKEALKEPELSAAVDTLSRLVTEIQYQITQARMVPMDLLFQRFPRMVRDLGKQQKKELELVTEGGEIELDRTVVEEMGEVLVHLLRNAVDHGLETPEERKAAGKSPQGLLKVSASRTKEFAVVEVADDGQGLDLEEIKRQGIRRGLLSAASTPEEVTEAVFAGLSTTRTVTAVSGRGLGLDIVKRKVESLGGAVKVVSEPGKGTRFRLEVPLTLAILKALFVQVGGKVYAIPLSNIERIVSVPEKEIKGMMEYDAFVLGEEEIPVTRLARLFQAAEIGLPKLPIVVVRRGGQKLGLAVDALVATQEIVVKPLGPVVRENRYFSGSAIIGTGEVILVLDVANLVLSERAARPVPAAPGAT